MALSSAGKHRITEYWGSRSPFLLHLSAAMSLPNMLYVSFGREYCYLFWDVFDLWQLKYAL